MQVLLKYIEIIGFDRVKPPVYFILKKKLL